MSSIGEFVDAECQEKVCAFSTISIKDGRGESSQGSISCCGWLCCLLCHWYWCNRCGCWCGWCDKNWGWCCYCCDNGRCVDDDWGNINWDIFAFYGGLLNDVCDGTVTGFRCQWVGSFKSRDVMKGSGNKLFSWRCLASGSDCFFVDIVWVLGIF
jgi:hypothetical protein